MPSKVEAKPQPITRAIEAEVITTPIDETTALALAPREMQLSRKPELTLKEAKEVAALLRKEVFKLVKPANIRGKDYPLVEHWTTVASFYGVFARITESKFVEFGEGSDKVRGWEAHAQAVVASTGQVISDADAMCCDDEPTWEARPLHALRAMAQTRAVGRVLRNPFSRIMVLAGVEPTPAEEMPNEGNGRAAPQMPARKEGDPNPITQPQVKRFWAIAKKHGWTDDEVKSLLKNHGYEKTAEISRADYDGMVKELEVGAVRDKLRESADQRPTLEERAAADWGGEVPPPEAEAKPTGFTINCTWNADKKTALITGHTDLVEARMKNLYGLKINEALKGYVLVASWVQDLKDFCDEKGINFVEQ